MIAVAILLQCSFLSCNEIDSVEHISSSNSSAEDFDQKYLLGQERDKQLTNEDVELIDCYGARVQRYNCYQLKVGLIAGKLC